MAYAFMSTEKVKTISALGGKMKHNYRLNNVINADPNREHWNDEIIKLQDEDYIAAYDRKISESDYYKVTKVRKDAVKAIEVMMTFNSSEVGEDFNLQEWKDRNVTWLQETFGKDNVVSAMCHMDESSPHIHALVIPMVNQRLNAKNFLGGKSKLVELQNSYGKAMEPLGLQRGIKGSRVKHQDIKRFYGAINQELSKDLPEVQMNENIPETAEEYRNRVNEYYKDINLKHLAELQKKDREIDEAKTHDLNDTISQKQARVKLEKAHEKIREYVEFEREYGPLSYVKGKLTTLEQLNKGRVDYLETHPEEQNMIHELSINMQKVINWKRRQDAKKRRETNLKEDLMKKM